MAPPFVGETPNQKELMMSFETCRFCDAVLGGGYDGFRHTCPGKEAWVKNELEPQLKREAAARKASRDELIRRGVSVGIPAEMMSIYSNRYEVPRTVVNFIKRLEKMKAELKEARG
jgi:hypothetical protein